MVTNILNEIGLTESEKKVYLSLLDLGESTRGDIVNKSGVTGSKVYELLEKLQEKGLVSIYIKDNIKHFKPTNPKQILNYIEQKKNKIINLEKQAQMIIPELLSKFNSSKVDDEIELISGIHGLEVIFREQIDILKKGETCYVIGGTWGNGEIYETTIQAFFEKILLMREKKGINTKMLFNLNQKASTESLYILKKYPCMSLRFIDHVSPVAINVYENKTIIIIFSKKISSIFIRSKDVSDSFKQYFELLWKTAKK